MDSCAVCGSYSLTEIGANCIRCEDCGDVQYPVDSWGNAKARIDNLPPEGDVIRLPDGTVIVVGPVEGDDG